MINRALKWVSHQIMSNNELFHYNPVWVIMRLICQCRFWQVLQPGRAIFTRHCATMHWKQLSLTLNLIYIVQKKKKKDRCCYSFPKHTTNALGHDLSLLFSARSPTLKTWSFWILIKHQGTSQGVLAWQRKLLWFMYYFVVPAWSLPVMRDCGDEWKDRAIIIIC